jgi:hypothetical protein
MHSKRSFYKRCLALALLLPSGIMASPVTGPWTKIAGVAVMSNTDTASPTWGDGTADNADASTIYSAFPDITLLNAGEKIVLSGSMTLVGVTTGGENLRFGIFNENGSGTTNGWLGYFLRNGSGSTVASIMERASPNTGAFTSTTGAANVGTAPVAGSVAGPTSDTYDFTITFLRNATNGLVLTTSLKRTTDGVDFGSLTDVLDVTPLTFTFNRVGFQGTTNLNADKIQLTNVDVRLVLPVVANPRIVNVGVGNGAFFVDVTGMDRSRTYKLKRSSDLMTFPDTVDSFTGDTDYSFFDQSPPAGKAFYRLEVAP